MLPVAIIGSGAWGTTLALLLANKGVETTLWEHQPERAAEMQQQRENRLFLPGFAFPAALRVTSDIAQAVRHTSMLILVTPSQRMRENIRLLAPYVAQETVMVSASKGIEI
ncbi:MAG: 2-dehydropantoate 2-reductase N-terminal domain-containing protein, partial [Ktedonobacteraceae bacterium]